MTRVSLSALLLAAAALAVPAGAQQFDDGSGYGSWAPDSRPQGPRGPRGPAEVSVPPGASINEAIERIRPGGTIKLSPGIYSEDVYVEKAVNIIGATAGNAKTEIRPSSTGACIYVAPDVIGAVTVARVTFRVTELYGSVPCVVVDGGVFSLKDSEVIARDNVPGVLLRGGIAHIENATIVGGRFGILVEPGVPNRGDFYVIGNTITKNQTGLRVQGAGRVNAIANEISGNTADGVVIFGGGGTFIANTIAANQSNGVVLNEGIRNPRFVSNRIEGNALAGIYVPLGGSAQLSRNEIVQNGGEGYRCEQQPCPPITGNLVEQNAGDEPPRRGGLFD